MCSSVLGTEVTQPDRSSVTSVLGQFGPQKRTEVTEDRSDRGPKWMYPKTTILTKNSTSRINLCRQANDLPHHALIYMNFSTRIKCDFNWFSSNISDRLIKTTRVSVVSTHKTHKQAMHTMYHKLTTQLTTLRWRDMHETHVYCI